MENMTDFFEITEAEKLPAEDSTEELLAENIRRKREGRLEDTAAVQGIVCLIAVIGLVLLNIWQPDMAEKLFDTVKGFSVSETALFDNPIDMIIELAEKLCQK